MAIFVTLFFGAIIISLMYYLKYRYSRRNLYKCSSMIPGPPSLPFIGSAHLFLGASEIELFECLLYISSYANNDGLVKVWLGPNLKIGISKPEWIEIVLNSEFSKGEELLKSMKPYISNSLINAEPKIWKKRRKVLSPTFSQKYISNYFGVFLEKSKILIDKLSINVDDKEFDIFIYLKFCLMDIISETKLCMKSNLQNNRNTDILEFHEMASNLSMQRMMKYWLQFDWIFELTSYGKCQKNIIDQYKTYIQSVIDNRTTYKQENSDNIETCVDGEIEKTFIDILLDKSENEKSISIEDRNGEISSISIVGTDTVSSVVAFTLMILGSLTDIQDEVMKELNEIFGKSTRDITENDLKAMKFLECVIKESMRLFPSVPVFSRYVTRDIQLEKYTLPAGCVSVIFVYYIHRNPKYWGMDAAEFNPNRFLPENSKKHHPYMYLPFGRGPRDCIGKRYGMMATKMILCEILRNYEISSNFNYKNPKLYTGISLKPTEGFKISIKRRS